MERFWKKVARGGQGECWLWLGAVSSKGYGWFRFRSHAWRAHRVAYTLVIGEIPEGLTLDHLCRIKLCVNPAHLEAVTGRENTLRGQGPTAINARKTHCPRGHELTPENTYWRTAGRSCLKCEKALQAKHILIRSEKRRAFALLRKAAGL